MSEQRRVLVGRVLSNRMDKTVVVALERTQRHPLYGKVIAVRKKYKAHDAGNACQIGDLVRMVESRPLSREKRWGEKDAVKVSTRFITLAMRCLRKGLISRGTFAEMVEIDRPEIDDFIKDSGLMESEGKTIAIENLAA